MTRPSKRERKDIKARKSQLELWSAAVRLRDSYTCCHCGIQNRCVDAHHILYKSIFPEFKLLVSNGKTTCRDCHINHYHKELKQCL